jgi:hypothetical protein
MAPASPSAKVKSVVAMGLRMNGAEKFMNSLEGADWTGRCFYTVTVLFTFPKMLRKNVGRSQSGEPSKLTCILDHWRQLMSRQCICACSRRSVLASANFHGGTRNLN